MGVLYGVIAAVMFGTNDWSAMRARRAATSRQVVATGTGAAGLMLLVMAPFWSGRFDLRSVGIGALSGLGICLGLSLLTYAFSIAPMGATTPLNAVVGTSVPVLWDAVRGKGLSGLSLAGMVIGLIAVGLTAYVPGGTGSRRMGLILGAVTGVVFGVAFTVMSYADRGSGIWPVASQRFTSGAVLAVFALARREPVLAPSTGGRWDARRTAAWSGMISGIGVISLIAGYRLPRLTPTAIASSQGAAVGVLLAAAFDHQKLRWWQVIGLILAGVGLAFLAIG